MGVLLLGIKLSIFYAGLHLVHTSGLFLLLNETFKSHHAICLLSHNMTNKIKEKQCTDSFMMMGECLPVT